MSGSECFEDDLQASTGAALPAAVIGTLLAIVDGQTPLVAFPGQPGSAALPARSCIDLHGAHIGQAVLLVFQQGDARAPIVTGVLRPAGGWPLADAPGTLELDADGERLVLQAKSQLVLRCGKASITLSASGRVCIAGTQVASLASGVNRIKGGSVQLN